jgi:hypothetical protein
MSVIGTTISHAKSAILNQIAKNVLFENACLKNCDFLKRKKKKVFKS